MKDELITFKTAKLAKEKGFPHINLGLNNMYDKNGNFYNSVGPTFDEVNSFQAPTQSLLQKWLREKKNIVVLPYLYDRDREDIFSYEIVRRINNLKCETPYLSYEEALEKGLQETLKLI